MTPPAPHARSASLLRFFRPLAFTLPFGLLAAWIAAVSLHASIVIDGVRYFYLDDGQMVSLRYARNLAEGLGLVWNAGERVEGYSNPAWTVLMVVVHLGGTPAPLTSLIVKAAAALCAAGVLIASLRLRRLLGRSTSTGDVLLLCALALNADVVFWAANGFETPLLTATFLWLIIRVVEETNCASVSSATLIAAGTLPLIRSDAHLLAAAIAAIAIGLSRDRRQAVRVAPLVLLLPFVHLLVRLAYYGDWLPNTFYLRPSGASQISREGVRHIQGFVWDYWILIAATVWGVVMARSRQTLWLLPAVAATLIYSLLAGSDGLPHFLFMAPAVPILLVLAWRAAETSGGSAVRRRILLAGVTVAAIVAGDMIHRWPVDALRSWRGKPWDGVVMGVLFERYSRPDASIAAVEIGALGYFSRRHVVDLAGRTDPDVAHGPLRAGADAAARKFDVEKSLGSRPDFLLTGAPHEASRLGEVMFALSGIDASREVGPAILASGTFRQAYRDNPLPLGPLLRRSAVYVRRGSPELAMLSRWQFPDAPF